MKLTADTNLLLRLVTPDDAHQQDIAIEASKTADLVAISVHVLCEMAWVMERRYGAPRTQITRAIRQIMATQNVVFDRPAVEAGLALLEAGGDFADGVIAFDGRRLGAETFASFDRKAVKLLAGHGIDAFLLS